MEFGIRSSEFGNGLTGLGVLGHADVPAPCLLRPSPCALGPSPFSVPHSPFPSSPWIKVCGVRSFADLEACACAGATHVGLNAWPGSPRFVAPGSLRGLLDAAPRLGLVPVVVHLPGSPVSLETASAWGAAFLQLLEPPPPRLGRRLEARGTALLEARRLSPGTARSLPWGSMLLLDACDARRPGGTGKTLRPEAAQGVPRPFVLAGGLGPDNVARAISAFRPAGVDAASGLESAPGTKDHGKIRAFCAAAREAFQQTEPQE
jgi:phosphoribosylanthranilate isomerase